MPAAERRMLTRSLTAIFSYAALILVHLQSIPKDLRKSRYPRGVSKSFFIFLRYGLLGLTAYPPSFRRHPVSAPGEGRSRQVWRLRAGAPIASGRSAPTYRPA